MSNATQTTLFRIISEYDMGHENLVFSTPAAAKEWLRAEYAAQKIQEDTGETFEEYWDGLCDTEEVTFVR